RPSHLILHLPVCRVVCFLLTVAANWSLQPSSAPRASLFTYKGRTFSRSYGTILPSSFTRVLSSALGFSPHPPVSVYGTVLYQLKLRGFSWKHGINHFAPVGARHHASAKLSGFAWKARLHA